MSAVRGGCFASDAFVVNLPPTWLDHRFTITDRGERNYGNECFALRLVLEEACPR